MEFINKPIRFLDLVDNYNEKFDARELINEFHNNKKTIGLLFGQVQSGKTNYIQQILDICFNEKDYKLIFCMTSNNNMLSTQTTTRLEEKATNYYVTNNTQDNIGVIKNKIAFVINKNTTTLTNMSNIIDYNRNEKILIIDDESDYGSIDISRTSNSSSINNLINKSYYLLSDNGSGMLQVTATPFSNITNTKNKNKTDFIYSLPINEYYTGLDYFDSLDDFYITTDDINKLNCFLNKDLALSTWNNKFKYLFATLIISLMLYYQFRIEENDSPFDMVVFDDLETLNHNETKEIINDFLINDNLFLNHLRNNTTTFYDFLNLLKLSFSKQDFIKFLEEIINNKKYQLFVLNSNQKLSFFDQYKSNKKEFNILIGGTYISRGNTFENLKTEIMLNENNIIFLDTLLQRCRWFGYREKYSKYMRVIVHNSIFNALKLARELNSHFIKNKFGGPLDINILKNIIIDFDNNSEFSNVRTSNDIKRN